MLLEIILCVVIILLVFNILITIRVYQFKANQSEIERSLDDFKFNQQSQYLTTQKMFTADLTQTKEQLLLQVSQFNDRTMKELLTFQNRLTSDLYKNFERLTETIHQNLNQMNERVELRLNEGFQQTNETFNNILERLGKIDEAQKKIEGLSTNIISLQDVLTDKKARGTFGEVQLNHILSSIFGENNTKIYEIQKTLSNQKIADAILHTPKPLGSIVIDSKFPLENYQRMVSNNKDSHYINQATRQFKQDVKKHIIDIKEKYIISNETADSAIMFIPAEAVFAEINAYHQDLIEFSQQHKVWMASPTTLMFLLTTVQIILRNIERDKYSALIQEELNKLGEEFKRYKIRWDKLSRNIDQVSRNVKELHTTSDKIEKHFDSISKVDFKDNDESLLK